MLAQYEEGKRRQAELVKLEADFRAGIKTRGEIEGEVAQYNSKQSNMVTTGERTSSLFEDGNNREWRRQEREMRTIEAEAAKAKSAQNELVDAATAKAAAERMYLATELKAAKIAETAARLEAEEKQKHASFFGDLKRDRASLELANERLYRASELREQKKRELEMKLLEEEMAKQTIGAAPLDAAASEAAATRMFREAEARKLRSQQKREAEEAQQAQLDQQRVGGKLKVKPGQLNPSLFTPRAIYEPEIKSSYGGGRVFATGRTPAPRPGSPRAMRPGQGLARGQRNSHGSGKGLTAHRGAGLRGPSGSTAQDMSRSRGRGKPPSSRSSRGNGKASPRGRQPSYAGDVGDDDDEDDDEVLWAFLREEVKLDDAAAETLGSLGIASLRDLETMCSSPGAAAELGMLGLDDDDVTALVAAVEQRMNGDYGSEDEEDDDEDDDDNNIDDDETKAEKLRAFLVGTAGLDENVLDTFEALGVGSLADLESLCLGNGAAAELGMLGLDDTEAEKLVELVVKRSKLTAAEKLEAEATAAAAEALAKSQAIAKQREEAQAEVERTMKEEQESAAAAAAAAADGETAAEGETAATDEDAAAAAEAASLEALRLEAEAAQAQAEAAHAEVEAQEQAVAQEVKEAQEMEAKREAARQAEKEAGEAALEAQKASGGDGGPALADDNFSHYSMTSENPNSTGSAEKPDLVAPLLSQPPKFDARAREDAAAAGDSGTGEEGGAEAEDDEVLELEVQFREQSSVDASRLQELLLEKMEPELKDSQDVVVSGQRPVGADDGGGVVVTVRVNGFASGEDADDFGALAAFGAFSVDPDADGGPFSGRVRWRTAQDASDGIWPADDAAEAEREEEEAAAAAAAAEAAEAEAAAAKVGVLRMKISVSL